MMLDGSPSHSGAPRHPGLSKSRVVAGWACPRLLWWRVHRPDSPEMQASLEEEDRKEQGRQVGELATERFPGGVLIDLPPDRIARKVEATRQALADGAPAIFEASFAEDGVFVAVDVLERRGSAFRLIEVKASTQVKDQHVVDAAVQLHVLRKAGLRVDEVALMHLDEAYRHPDGEIFTLSDITEDVEAELPGIPDLLETCREILDGDDPGSCIGDQCGRMQQCALDAACWPPEPDHIRRLHGVGTKTALKYMKQGVHTFGDLPPEARIREPARRQIEVWRSGEPKVEPTLARELEPFRGRLGFLDFETISRAVPLWDGLGPYGKAPVQFSYHERMPDGALQHVAWLAEGPEDPRPGLARALVEATKDADRVVVYSHFERQCIDALVTAVPDLAVELEALKDRFLDLQKVVKRNLAHPDFHGSYSIKKVLTPLVPDLAYDGMDVADGMTASVELARFVTRGAEMDPEAYAAKKEALLEYCRLDTLAMVRLLEALEALA